MENKKTKIMAVVVISMLTVTTLLGSYWTLKKEQLYLTVNGETKEVSTFKNTVKELLKEQNVYYDEDDIIHPNLDENIIDHMEINITKVKKVYEVESKVLSYEEEVIEDSNLDKGKTQIVQDGKEGIKEIEYELVYHNDKLVSEKVRKEEIVSEPINEVIKKGTKDPIALLVGDYTSSKQLKVEASAYTGHGITSTGTVPKWGTIAVDPSIIPYGTNVYIPQFDMIFTAEDCGGAIKGNKIDIYMNSNSQAYDWGRRTIDIHIIQ